MPEGDAKKTYIQQQKLKIRQRYKGINMENVTIIPVTASEPDFYDDNEPKRVAVYARVSTDDPRQTSSYELQKNYYERQIQEHPNWTLAAIYADEGLSGTSTKKRKEFNRMIADCKAGKIDLILTKSVSRFARNYVDCGAIVRELMALNPPVGVYFESENLFTLKMQGDMQLMLFSGIAQEESRIKSNAMNASIEMRFGSGIYLTPPLLGYDQDEDGNLAINQQEAKIVRLIFFLYLFGCTCQQIAAVLTELGCRTKRGNTTWSAGSILQVLRNERHCGAVRARKTFTPNYLDHKSRKNCGDRLQYYMENHHEPIISVDDYLAVQKLICNAKYGSRGILPEIHTVPEGALKGFADINPRWSGFTAEDYSEASMDACEQNPTPRRQGNMEVFPGDFDLRGFEVARSQFFSAAGKPYATFSAKGIRFNLPCVQKLGETPNVELLVHPGEHVFAVRAAEGQNRNMVRWVQLKKSGQYIPRAVSGAAFIPTLYQLFGWNLEYRYRIRGICRRRDGEGVLLFHLGEAEIFLPGQPAGIAVFPAAWVDGVGNGYYAHHWTRELAAIDHQGAWQIMTAAEPPAGGRECDFTISDVVADGIQQLIPEIKKENGAGDGG